MAERRGTGGRGSLSTITGEGWGAVPEQRVITRVRSERSPLFAAVQAQLGNLSQYVERMLPAEDGAEPQPVTYSKGEAVEMVKELRRAGSQLKLAQRRLSLKITTDPSPVDEAPDDARIRVQFRVERRAAAAEAPPERSATPANAGGEAS